MKENTKPKYKIIEDYIISNIESGNLKCGDQIETEMSLSEKFNIGRLTVNKALINLAQEGYIERIAGKGSFVRANIVSKTTATSSSFSEDMRSVGKTPGSKLIEYRVIQGAENLLVADYLHLDPEDLIHYFVRLRTGDGEPIAMSYTYISAKVIPAIDVECLSNSLTEYLNSIGNYTAGAIHKMSAHLPTARQKQYLEIEDDALLRNAHITYNQDNVPYEYVETYYLSNKFEYVYKTGVFAKKD